MIWRHVPLPKRTYPAEYQVVRVFHNSRTSLAYWIGDGMGLWINADDGEVIRGITRWEPAS